MNWTDPFPSPGLSFLFWNTEEEWLGEAPGALTVPRVLYVPLTLGARPRFLGSPWLSTGDVSLRALTCLCVSREGRCPLSHPRCQTCLDFWGVPEVGKRVEAGHSVPSLSLAP